MARRALNFDRCLSKDKHRLQRRAQQTATLADDHPDVVNLLAAHADSERAFAARISAMPLINLPPELPISAHQVEIIEAIQSQPVVIVAGETGSGKSTQLPKLCLLAGKGRAGWIGHTQPRRLAARSVAQRVSEELASPLGQAAGYKVRFNDRVSEQSYIKLLTDGMLLAELQHDKFLNQYDTLIIDEAHERSLNIDFLLGYLKKLLQKRSDLTLIITSATINVQAFSQHFGNAPIIEVSGRSYPVSIDYLPLALENGDSMTVTEGICEAAQALIQTGDGDILVFVPGERAIREAVTKLRTQFKQRLEVLPLHARLTSAQQDKIFHPGSQRRIIVATNIAETSLTVPRIHYVIDTGLARISRYSYAAKVQRLPIEPISQASADQRAGRCGRIAPGVCIRLYAQQDFESRPLFTEPEILRTNLASVILQLSAWRLGAITEFPFLQSPDPRYVRDAVRLLQQLQALTANSRLTALGREMATLPLDPRLSAILVNRRAPVSQQVLCVVTSFLSVADPRERPAEKQAAADLAHAELSDPSSDFKSILILWQWISAHRTQYTRKQWQSECQKRYLSVRKIQEWREVYQQILRTLNRPDEVMAPIESMDNAALHSALLVGFVDYVAQKTEQGDYLGARQRRAVIHPSSAVKKAAPNWIMAASFLETGRVYAHTVAQIEPEWVLKTAQHLIKRHYSEPFWSSKRCAVLAYERATLYGLVLSDQQPVHYESIDPIASRAIFIREGLVNANMQLAADFFQHNVERLQDWHDYEARVRKIDIIEEEKLYQFYEQRLPQQIHNKSGLLRWLKIHPHLADSLYLHADFFIDASTQTQIVEQYPNSFAYQQTEFALSYQFEHQHPRDGVSVHIPWHVAHKIDPTGFQWLVPGMLYEKVEAVLRGLEKSHRRRINPIPRCVDQFLETAEKQSALYVELSRFLRNTYGLTVAADILAAVVLPRHLQMNFIIENDAGASIEGRDYDTLLSNTTFFQTRESASANKAAWAKQPFTQWTFADLAQQIDIEQTDYGIAQYPALVDRAQHVVIEVFSEVMPAEHAHARGVVRLFLLNQADKIKYLRKNAAELASLQLGFAHWAKVEDVLMQCLEVVCLASLPKVVPRTRTEFEDWSTSLRSHLIESTQILLSRLAPVPELMKTCQQQWQALQLEPTDVIDKALTAQWSALFHPQCIRQAPLMYLKRYPIYLQALQKRLAKTPEDWSKQRAQSEVLLKHRQQLNTKQTQLKVGAMQHPDLETYRWMLEELPVAWYAQPQKTLFPVSEKRLDKQWHKLRDLA